MKPLIAVHRPVGSMRTTNGLEFVNDDFQSTLGELDIMRKFTPVDNVKRNGPIERKLGLIPEEAKAAWLVFPRHCPDLQFSVKAPTWQAIWPRAFSWMNDGINISVPVDDNMDTLCAREELCGRRPTCLDLPFMLPGIRHVDRKIKLDAKAGVCFYLNSGTDHFSSTQRLYFLWGSPATLPTLPSDTTAGRSWGPCRCEPIESCFPRVLRNSNTGRRGSNSGCSSSSCFCGRYSQSF